MNIEFERGSEMKRAADVDFTIYGDDMQFVELYLGPYESIVAEAGAMMYMDENIKMKAIFGDGSAFIHAGGTVIEKQLKPGEVLKLDTGCLVAMTSTVDYDVEMIGDIKSALFGGEGLFLATLRGPGTVWLQSLPFSRLANRIFSAGSKGRSSGKGEGSILGSFGIGDLFGED